MFLASLNKGFQVNEGFQVTSYSELRREGSELFVAKANGKFMFQDVFFWTILVLVHF